MMNFLIGSSCFLLFIGPVIGDYELDQDMTYEYLKKFLNRSIDPCENFFEHMCPFDLKFDDIPLNGFLSRKLLKKLDQQTKVTALEKAFKAAQHPEDEDYYDVRRRYNTIKGLRLQPALYKHLESMNIDIEERMQALSAEFRLFSAFLIDQLRKTTFATLKNSTIQQLVEYELTQVVKTTEEIVPSEYLVDIYEKLTTNYDRLVHKYKLAPKAALAILSDMVDAIYQANPDLSELVAAFDDNNSGWMGGTRTVEIYNSYSLITINITRPTYWGLVIGTLGHELSHPIIDKADEIGDEDPHIAKNRKCLADFLAEAFKEFSEDEYGRHVAYPNDDTHSEAIPDYEGLQAAYLGYKKEIEDKGQELAYPDLGITNDQLFFYAYATSFCNVDPQRTRLGGDFHPPDFLRVNGILPLMNGYLEAFQCKPEQRMYKIRSKAPADKCNFFGEITKKLKEN